MPAGGVISALQGPAKRCQYRRGWRHECGIQGGCADEDPATVRSPEKPAGSDAPQRVQVPKEGGNSPPWSYRSWTTKWPTEPRYGFLNAKLRGHYPYHGRPTKDRSLRGFCGTVRGSRPTDRGPRNRKLNRGPVTQPSGNIARRGGPRAVAPLPYVFRRSSPRRPSTIRCDTSPHRASPGQPRARRPRRPAASLP